MLVKPYHKFDDGHGTCLIDIERMKVCRIDDATSQMLDQIFERPCTSFPADVCDRLRKLDLLADNPAAQSKTTQTALPAIRHVALLVAQKCNFKCVYCFGGDGSYGSEGEMDRATAQIGVNWLIRQSQETKRLRISFFGGEPLLNFPLIKHVVAYAREKAEAAGKTVQFGVSTNGSLLNDDKIDFIREHRIGVTVGFDGFKKAQDAQRPFLNGRGSYDLTVPRIRRLLSVVPDAGGRAMLTGDTDPVMAERGLYDLGFSRVAVDVPSPSLCHPHAWREGSERMISRLSKAAEQEAGALLESIKRRETGNIRRLQKVEHVLAGKCLDSFLHNTKRYYPCMAGRLLVAVSCTGDVYPCFRFVGNETYRIGTVFEHELDRELFRSSPIKSVEKCSNCFAKYICAGGCRYDHLAANGSLFEPNEVRCGFMRSSVEALASLTSRLNREDKDYLYEEGIIRRKSSPFDF